MEITSQPTTADGRETLAAFVDRVVVPALVERFLRDHGVQTSVDALAKPKPAA